MLSIIFRQPLAHFTSSSIKLRTMSTLLADFLKNPINEPILDYAPGSTERAQVDIMIESLKSSITEVPIVIGDEEISLTSNYRKVVMPSDHEHVLAQYNHADRALIKNAIENSLSVRKNWESKPLIERAEIFFKAGDLVATKYRAKLNAATMLGQAKTYIQAEIDSACELADFFRFNAFFAMKMDSDYQPISVANVKNEYSFRGLDGFVAAISPFNFTAIGGNLCGAPALMGNVVVWKPSDTSLLSNWITFQVLKEAGLPPGVVNFVPADGPSFGAEAFGHPKLAAVNFTGSLGTFRRIWQNVAANIDKFDSFPRMIGECSGKNFHFVHKTADLDTVVPCSIRAAFEYQGQKCSALARMYVPESLWPTLKERLVQLAKEITVGQPNQRGVFMSAVIDKIAFDRISSYIQIIKKSSTAKILHGGQCDSSKGFFIEPTIVECSSVNERFFQDDIFGPILCVYPYPDEECLEILDAVKSHTKFALTGAVFAKDEDFLKLAKESLRDACGNFYVNDKCTGSIVGQQPFGGAGLSGTNDKAGGPHYLLRWASPLTTKTTATPLPHWRYPSMD